MNARNLVATVVAVLATAATAGCATGESSSAADAPTSSAATGSTAEATFPAVVAHQYGETTVPAPPERVVSVGVTEQDILLELGVVPVAVTEWYGEQPSATWPWAQPLLDGAEPEVLSVADGFELERIAALEPDLIVGTNAGMTKRDYELFSAIAPTVTSIEGATQYFSPWQDQTLQVARALGREADGQALVDRVEQAFADVAAAHPEWAEMSATFSQGGPYDGQLYVYPAGLSTEFLSMVGFTLTPGLEPYAPEEGSQAQISAENVDLIDADVIVFATESKAMFDELQDFGTIEHLSAVSGNRAVYTDEVLAGAIYFDTPLSLQHVLEQLTPQLELATRGEAPREYPS
jgi:iron complex transport system substrate-binding protein